MKPRNFCWFQRYLRGLCSGVIQVYFSSLASWHRLFLFEVTFTSVRHEIFLMMQKRLSKGIFWQQNLEVKGHFLKVISVGNQSERMFEPRSTAQKKRTANHVDFRWQGQMMYPEPRKSSSFPRVQKDHSPHSHHPNIPPAMLMSS